MPGLTLLSRVEELTLEQHGKAELWEERSLTSTLMRSQLLYQL